MQELAPDFRIIVDEEVILISMEADRAARVERAHVIFNNLAAEALKDELGDCIVDNKIVDTQ